MREIMDAMSPSHPCTDADFMKGTQIAGSEALYNVVGCFIDRAPCPIMLLMPTVDTAKRVSKQRLQPMIDETPVLRDKVKDSRSRDSGNTLLMKDFPGGVLVITGANSGPGLRSMPVRVLLQDEIDAYPADVDGEGDPCRVAEKRTDTFAGRAKRFRCSTPKIRGLSRIARRYDAGTQGHYYVPCPYCQLEQVLDWAQMRWELLDGGEELNRVWYECNGCQGRIEEHHKPWMLEHGRHIHHAPGAGDYIHHDDPHPHAIWVKTADGAARFLPRFTRPLSWHVSALYSLLGFTWAKAVQEYLDSQKGGINEDSGESDEQVFVNTVRGEPYEQKGEQPQDDLLKLRAEDYRLGIRPDAALLLVGACDVQGDRLEVAVKGYGPGEESWLVDYDVIFGDPMKASTWAALLELREKDYRGVRMTYLAIDSGYQTMTVYEHCRVHRRQGFFATKGIQQQGRPLLGRPSLQDVNKTGRVVKGGVQLWPIGVDAAKERIYRRLELTAGTGVGERGPGLMHFPSGLPDSYFEGLVSEKLIRRKVKGAEVREWVKTRERNEPLDLEVLCYAAAMRAGITRLDWKALAASVAIAAEPYQTAAQSGEAPSTPGVSRAAAAAQPAPYVARPGRRR
jgi:phage terminase large subunit GpA-like protein